jgi:hypothetical protein
VDVVRCAAQEREDVQRSGLLVEAAQLRRVEERDPELAVFEAHDLRRREDRAGKGPDGRGGNVWGPAHDEPVDEVGGEKRPIGILPRIRQIKDARRYVVRVIRNRRVEEGELASRFGQPELAVRASHERGRPPRCVGVFRAISGGRVEVRDPEAAELRDPERPVGVREERARCGELRHDPTRQGRAVRGPAGDRIVRGGDSPDVSGGVLDEVRAVEVSDRDARRGHARERPDFGACRDGMRGGSRRGRGRDGRRGRGSRRRRGRRARRGGRRGLLSESRKSQSEGGDREPKKAAGRARVCHVGHCNGPGCTLRSAPHVAKSGRFDAPEMLGVGFGLAGRPRTSESPTAPQPRSRNGRRDRGRPARENPSQGPEARRMRAFARNAVPGRKPRGKSVGSHRGANPGGSI